MINKQKNQGLSAIPIILGILTLALLIPATIKLVQQPQDTRRQATPAEGCEENDHWVCDYPDGAANECVCMRGSISVDPSCCKHGDDPDPTQIPTPTPSLPCSDMVITYEENPTRIEAYCSPCPSGQSPALKLTCYSGKGVSWDAGYFNEERTACIPSHCDGCACIAPTCGPANCPGCCRNEVCESGNEDSRCGEYGALCANCLSYGEVCNQGTCESIPTPTLTPTSTVIPTKMLTLAPQATLTPASTSTLIPTKTPPQCLSLYINGKIQSQTGSQTTFNLGDTIELKCFANKKVDHFDFKIKKPDGLQDIGLMKISPNILRADVGPGVNVTYKLVETGCYDFVSRVCQSTDNSDCSPWGGFGP